MYGVPSTSSGGGGGFLAGAGNFLSGPGGMSLLALLPSLLGGLFRRRDPMRQARAQIEGILDPFRIEQEGTQLYKDTLQSPGYNQARHDIVAGGQTGQMALARHLGANGLLGTGVGAGASAAVAAAPSIHLGKLSAHAWDVAMANAGQRATSRASILAGMPVEPNYGANLFAGGLNALLPLLYGRQKGDNSDILERIRQLLEQEA